MRFLKWLFDRVFWILSSDVERGFGSKGSGTVWKRTRWWGTGTSKPKDWGPHVRAEAGEEPRGKGQPPG